MSVFFTSTADDQKVFIRDDQEAHTVSPPRLYNDQTGIMTDMTECTDMNDVTLEFGDIYGNLFMDTYDSIINVFLNGHF